MLPIHPPLEAVVPVAEIRRLCLYVAVAAAALGAAIALAVKDLITIREKEEMP